MACVTTAPPSVARAPRVVGLAPRSVPRLPHPRGHDRSAHRGGVSPTRFRLPTQSTTRVLASADDSFPPRLVDPSRASSGLGASGSAPPSCVSCDDTGLSPCRACQGSGALSPGGFHAKNHVDLRSVIGTNWTAHVRTEGWRHFEATETRPADKKACPPRQHASVKLTATCDRNVSVWVSVKDLKDRLKWSAGWKRREELTWRGDQNSRNGAVAVPKQGPVCPKCCGDMVEVCDQKNCVYGLKKRRDIEKQQAVIRETTVVTRRALRSARKKATEEGDENAAAFVGRAKRTLKDTGKAKKSKREKRRAARLTGEDETDDFGVGSGGSVIRGKSTNTREEDWGALARARRDEKLEAFLSGVKPPTGPESRQ